MSIFIKATAGVLTALILCIHLHKYSKDFSLLLAMAVCTIVIIAAIHFLSPIFDFINNLRTIGNVDNNLLSVMLKVVGVGLLAEFTSLVCKDAGNESMGKALQVLSSVVVLWLSLPVFEELLSLLDKIMGTV